MSKIPIKAAKRHKVLTDKQKAFVTALATSESITEAAITSYNTSNRASAASIGSRVIKEIKESFPEVMERIGLTDEALLKPLVRNLDAKKSWFSKAKGEMVTEDDGFTQLKAVEIGLKLKGRFPKESSEVEHNFNFVISRGETVEVVKLDNVPSEEVALVPDNKERN